MISIILPLYNKAKYIERSIKSVLAQNFSAFELIIIDDGSTDDSLKIASTFLGDKRVIILNQENKGVSAARNRGIIHTKNDLIAFLDADDLWHPEYLSEQIRVFSNYPTIGISVCNYQIISADQIPHFQPIERRIKPKLIDNYFRKKNRDHLFWTSATVVRKTAVNIAGAFNTSLTSGEDLDLWFRIMLKYNGAYIPQVMAFYRETEGEYKNEFNVPDINNHLVGNILDIYSYLLKDKNSIEKGFDKFVYQFTLTHLFLYYFNPNFHKQSLEIYKRIPLKYKFSQPKYFLFLLPYYLSKRVFGFSYYLKKRISNS